MVRQRTLTPSFQGSNPCSPAQGLDRKIQVFFCVEKNQLSLVCLLCRGREARITSAFSFVPSRLGSYGIINQNVDKAYVLIFQNVDKRIFCAVYYV